MQGKPPIKMAAKVDAADLEHRFKMLTPWSNLEVQLSKSTTESVASLGFDGMTAVQVSTQDETPS